MNIDLIGAKAVYQSPALPVEQTYPASNIETKEEVKIPSGEWIHVIELDGKLIVSSKIYEELQRIAKNKPADSQNNNSDLK
jgi:hypothetical protein